MSKYRIILICAVLTTLLVALPATTVALETNGRIIIGFPMDMKTKITKSYVKDILSKAKVNYKKILYVDNKLKFAVIKTSDSVDTIKSKLIKAIGSKVISYVEPDVVYSAIEPIKASSNSNNVKADYIPNDPFLASQWGLFSINATDAWNIEKGNNSIIVAVVDTGIDYTHPDLAANYLSGGYDFVNNDTDPLDDNGHGTHCAGIIAAVIDNNIGVAGVAQVKIMAEKVLDASGAGYSSWIARGIAHAVDHGARIISMSLGSFLPSYTIKRACLYAWKNGCLLVAAAGNEGWYGVDYPARYLTVMAVGALNPDRTKAWFSNYGTGLEIMAPGVDILSTTPTYPVYLNVSEGVPLNYAYLSGTSMACPHVAGVAALVWSHYPNLTNLEVRWILDHSTIDLGASGWDIYYGFGEVNAYYALLNASTYTLSK